MAKQDNILNAFSSYNCIFTLGILTSSQVISADYRANGPFATIIRSGGTGNNQIQTLYEKNLGITAEYYIDDVSVNSIIAPTSGTRQTNATNLSFTVHEPYSMGMFLQSLAIAAQKAGHSNYAKAPYMLSLEFVGWDTNGKAVKIPNSSRYFPLFFTNIGFNVSAGGSIYEVEAIPWNEQAFSDEVQKTKEDYDVYGKTVHELLQLGEEGRESFIWNLNSKEETSEEADQKTVRDSYVIIFPKSKAQAGAPPAFGGDQGATQPVNGETNTQSVGSVTAEDVKSFADDPGNVNEIGAAKVKKEPFDKGHQRYGREEFQETNDGIFKRGPITLYEDEARINIKKGTRIQDAIEEIVILSDYGRKLALEEPDSEGMKKWFRIETDVYPIDDPANEARIGRKAMIYVYKVIPFKYHASKTQSPSSASPGIDALKAAAVKEYNYIYSGKNDDIISFDLSFKTAFYQQINFDLGQLGQEEVEGGAGGQTKNAESPTPVTSDAAAQQSKNGSAGNKSTEQTPRQNTGQNQGGTQVYPETQIARMFNEAIVSGVDLISIDLEIWGDPYYIADSGMGNYSSPPTGESPNINADGSIEWRNREVDVLLNFRTPVDINSSTGLYDFPGIGTEPVAEFSGVYQVLSVTNTFNQNKFTQSLEMIRRANQIDGEYKSSVVEGGSENQTAETADKQGAISDAQRQFSGFLPTVPAASAPAAPPPSARRSNRTNSATVNPNSR
jgi:hypothetical protein